MPLTITKFNKPSQMAIESERNVNKINDLLNEAYAISLKILLNRKVDRKALAVDLAVTVIGIVTLVQRERLRIFLGI